MELLPLDNDEAIRLAASWLGEQRNYQWLDFGNGAQAISAISLKVMAQKDSHILRLFTDDDGAGPIGLVGLSNVDRHFKTAMLWTVLGDRRFSLKGYVSRAVIAMLSFGFREVGLQAINVWAVESNHASLRIIRKLGFQPIGRQRQCHYMDGKAYDRLWFDLLASEHMER